MKRFSRFFLRTSSLFLVISLIAFPISPAWGMHEGIPCSSCHRFLNNWEDQQNTSELIKTRICLTCHDADRDQSDLNPPYVLNETAPLPAGGSFSPTLLMDNVGHNILTPDSIHGSTPPGGDPLHDFGCLSCHDAHDNGNYRNLKKEIRGKSTLVQAVGDPDYRANIYISGMDAFCEACHQRFHAETETHRRGDLLHHPVGVSIYGAKDADFQNWLQKTRELSLVEYPDGRPDNPYTAKVFCLSCHYAHASSFAGALRWDPPGNRGCLECHDPDTN